MCSAYASLNRESAGRPPAGSMMSRTEDGSCGRTVADVVVGGGAMFRGVAVESLRTGGTGVLRDSTGAELAAAVAACFGCAGRGAAAFATDTPAAGVDEPAE